MKKIATLFLALAIVGCGQNNEKVSEKTPTIEEQVQEAITVETQDSNQKPVKVDIEIDQPETK